MSAVECKEPGFYKDFDERTDPGDDAEVEFAHIYLGYVNTAADGKEEI